MNAIPPMSGVAPRAVRPSYYLSQKLLLLLFRLYFRLEVYHIERVPRQGAALLAVNHTSFLDPPLAGCALPREVHFLARQSLFRVPVFGPLIKHMNAVELDRDGSSVAGLTAILNRLGQGQGIVIFPEGTRSQDGSLQRGQSGVGWIVVKSTAPVVPVRIFGSFKALGRHHKIPRPSKLIVKYGQAMGFEEQRFEAATASRARLKMIYQDIADEIMRAIARLEPCRERARFP